MGVSIVGIPQGYNRDRTLHDGILNHNRYLESFWPSLER